MRQRAREEALQRAVARYLDLALPDDAVSFHVPNGGGRTKAEGGALKAQGVKAGIPDHLVIHAGRPLFIELKTASGRVTPQQREMHDGLIHAGAKVAVCRSIEDVADFLRSFDVPLRAARDTRRGGD